MRVKLGSDCSFGNHWSSKSYEVIQREHILRRERYKDKPVNKMNIHFWVNIKRL